jgi:hypothetical protein
MPKDSSVPKDENRIDSIPLFHCLRDADMERPHVSLGAVAIRVSTITDDDTDALRWWSFGNSAPLGRGVLNNVKWIGKRGRR